MLVCEDLGKLSIDSPAALQTPQNQRSQVGSSDLSS